jgi:hypothetical protein
VVIAPAIKSSAIAVKTTINQRKEIASDSDASSSEASDDVTQDSDTDDDDGPEYEDLSKKELLKISNEVRQCIGRKFFDADDGNTGVVVSIVRELRSNELCFKYLTSEVLRNDEYMWVSSLTDESITWEDVDDNNDDADSSSYYHSHALGVKKKRQTQSSSWVYETSVSKSIFEDTVIPAGEKRGGRRS